MKNTGEMKLASFSKSTIPLNIRSLGISVCSVRILSESAERVGVVVNVSGVL